MSFNELKWIASPNFDLQAIQRLTEVPGVIVGQPSNRTAIITDGPQPAGLHRGLRPVVSLAISLARWRDVNHFDRINRLPHGAGIAIDSVCVAVSRDPWQPLAANYADAVPDCPVAHLDAKRIMLVVWIARKTIGVFVVEVSNGA